MLTFRDYLRLAIIVVVVGLVIDLTRVAGGADLSGPAPWWEYALVPIGSVVIWRRLRRATTDGSN